MSGIGKSELVVYGSLVAKHEPVVGGWLQHELVPVIAETELRRKLLRDLWPHVQARIRAAFRGTESKLQPLFNEFPKQTKEPHEVALSRSVGADQQVHRPEFELLQLSNG